MAVSATPFALFWKSMFNKEIDYDSDGIKLMLCTSTFAPNTDTMQYKSSVTNEVSGTGYTATGNSIGTVSMAYTTANSWGVSRSNTTAYTVGQIIRPASANGFLYQCTTGGTSGGSVPTYPTAVGSTVTDGSVVWTCMGRGAFVVAAGASVSWAASTITARYGVLYDSTPATDATRPLIGLVDFGADVSTVATSFDVTWDPQGIMVVFVV
jgi:hypothetical protein